MTKIKRVMIPVLKFWGGEGGWSPKDKVTHLGWAPFDGDTLNPNFYFHLSIFNHWMILIYIL